MEPLRPEIQATLVKQPTYLPLMCFFSKISDERTRYMEFLTPGVKTLPLLLKTLIRKKTQLFPGRCGELHFNHPKMSHFLVRERRVVGRNSQTPQVTQRK